MHAGIWSTRRIRGTVSKIKPGKGLRDLSEEKGISLGGGGGFELDTDCDKKKKNKKKNIKLSAVLLGGGESSGAQGGRFRKEGHLQKKEPKRKAWEGNAGEKGFPIWGGSKR